MEPRQVQKSPVLSPRTGICGSGNQIGRAVHLGKSLWTTAHASIRRRTPFDGWNRDKYRRVRSSVPERASVGVGIRSEERSSGENPCGQRPMPRSGDVPPLMDGTETSTEESGPQSQNGHLWEWE